MRLRLLQLSRILLKVALLGVRLKLSELTEVHQRIHRLSEKLNQKSGVGFNYSHTFENGETYYYQVNGVKPIEEFQDELLSTFIWAWSIKDYLKEIAKRNGFSAKGIEEIVNKTPSLQYLSDVANKAKHGVLRESRSGLFAELSPVVLSIPQEAAGTIVFGAFEMTRNVDHPDAVDYVSIVRTKHGKKLGDAQTIITESITAWEKQGNAYAFGNSTC